MGHASDLLFQMIETVQSVLRLRLLLTVLLHILSSIRVLGDLFGPAWQASVLFQQLCQLGALFLWSQNKGQYGARTVEKENEGAVMALTLRLPGISPR